MDKRTFERWAREAGFGEVGFCSAAGFEAQRARVQSEPPLAERKQLRFFPQQDDARTRSLAVLLWPYAQREMPRSGYVFVDGYYPASNAAYHAARALGERLCAAGCFAKANVSYPAREAAVRAGLGHVGKSGLLITPQHGTRVVIILMATDIACDGPDHAAQTEADCLRCGRCAAACPSGALDAQGMSHPARCMRNFMMEGIVVPEQLRGKMDMRLLGCDICQRVCPMQPHAAQEPGEDIPLDAFVTADAQRFAAGVAQLADRIGRNAARPQRVRAQAALLAGNRGDAKDLPVLRAWAQSPFEAVREHARWAAEKIEAQSAGKTGQGT